MPYWCVLRSRASGQIYAGMQPDPQASNYKDDILDAFEYNNEDNHSLYVAIQKACQRLEQRKLHTLSTPDRK